MTTATPGVELVDRLLALSDDDKLDLALLLEESVRDGFRSLAEGQAKQKAELVRRLEAHAAGTEKSYPADEVLADLRQMLAEHRRLRERYRG